MAGRLSQATHKPADPAPGRTRQGGDAIPGYGDEQLPLGPGQDSSAGSPLPGLHESPNGVSNGRRQSPIKVVSWSRALHSR